MISWAPSHRNWTKYPRNPVGYSPNPSPTKRRTRDILQSDARVSRATPRPACIAPGTCYAVTVAALYDTIGRGYANVRKADPRFARAIALGLGDDASVVNVGAGTGAYEPADRAVIAVEPSTTMIAQRPVGTAPAVRATAMSLPFKNDSFDAALAVLTVHHWPDKALGLAELRRVASRRAVVLTWDPASRPFWLTDYFPELLHIDRPLFPTVRDFELALGPVSVATIPVPHDCSDGFLGAHWRRPAAYIEARVRGAISTFAKLPQVESRLEQLRADLASGEWQRKYGDLLDKTELDLGYQLIVAGV